MRKGYLSLFSNSLINRSKYIRLWMLEVAVRNEINIKMINFNFDLLHWEELAGGFRSV